MEIYKLYKHNPPHLFRENAKYFITGAIYQKKPYLIEKRAKQRLIESLYKGFTDSHWNLEDWVILHNHYHLIVEAPKNADSLSGIMRDIHKFTAMWMKKNIVLTKKAQKIWWNYWDICLSYENSYYARLNYIWHNPVKHGLIKKSEDWEFGSYYYRFKYEQEYLEKMKYPFERIKVSDNF